MLMCKLTNKKIIHVFMVAVVLSLFGCNPSLVKNNQSEVMPDVKKEIEIIEKPKEVLQKEPTITLGFVGDILLTGSAQPFLDQFGYAYPFENVQPILNQSDILFGNLEGPLTDETEIYIEKTYAFKSDAIKTSEALNNAGFDVLSLANNHALDYGFKGMLDTQNALDDIGIKHLGSGENKTQARQPVVVESNGIKVGYLAYNNTYPKEFWATDERFGVAYGKLSEFIEDIKNLEKISDIQIITFHWGREGQTQLRDYQPLFARAAIDAGADIVVGHHPHILQAVEKYNDGLILYSIGNFTFGTYGKLAKTSGIFNVEVSKSEVKKLEITGINVFNQDVKFKPEILQGDLMKEFYLSIDQLSKEVNTFLDFNNETISLDFVE